MKDFILPAVEDNAYGNLDATVSISSTSIDLVAGEGARFPQPITATATSVGTATNLPSTGIQAAGVAVGDFIMNLTDSTPASDSWAGAFVLSVAANSVTTTPLKGDGANIWDDGDVFVVKPFVINLSERTGDVLTGEIDRFEKVLITGRSTDTLTMPATSGYRGFDGTTIGGDPSDDFTTSDFVTIEVDQARTDGLLAMISRIFQDFPQDVDVLHKTGNETKAGVLTFDTDFPVLHATSGAAGAEAVSAEQSEDYADAIVVPFPKTVYTSGSTTLNGSASNTVTHGLTVNQADVEKGKYSVLVHGTRNFDSNGASWGSDGGGYPGGGAGIGTSAVLAHKWDAGSATDGVLYWTASTVKIHASQAVTNAIVQVVQNYA